MTNAQDDHPRMPLRERVPLAAAFALEHVAKGFTDRQLAGALNCSRDVAQYTRAELQHQLADSPIRLVEDGWQAVDDNSHHDVRRYRLKAATG